MRFRMISKVNIGAVAIAVGLMPAAWALAQSNRGGENMTPQSGSSLAVRAAAAESGSGIIPPASFAPPAPPSQAPPSASRFIDAANGATPDDLVRYALSHNGELAAARQIVAEARGRLRQAGLRPNPTL